MAQITAVSRITSAAASTNATSAKADPAELRSIIGYNANAAVRYLKLYDKASAPTVGTDAPLMTIPLAASSAFSHHFAEPVFFKVGLAYALTTGAADNDTGALTSGDVLGLNVAYT